MDSDYCVKVCTEVTVLETDPSQFLFDVYGLYLARELFPSGIVYFSQASHYSVSKNIHFLNMRDIMIRAQDNKNSLLLESIQQLRKQLKRFLYSIEDKRLIIIILKVGHRRDFYR